MKYTKNESYSTKKETQKAHLKVNIKEKGVKGLF